MSSTEVFGNVVEYIPDKLYLAAYTAPPTESTPFPPTPIPQPYINKFKSYASPTKRSKHNGGINPPKEGMEPVYFTVDDVLLYNAFYHDFGPLNVAHCYRFALTLHDILGDPENAGKYVVFYSKNEPRIRANAACLLASYMVLVQNWPPHLALAPISQVDPPFMPFRDAGYSQADYGISVQDVIYGVWKAKSKGLLDMREFCLDEYERYERADTGDFNWITPDFLAFASPKYSMPPDTTKLPTDVKQVVNSGLPLGFRNVLQHFKTRNVGLVVRLNSPLYPPQYFTALDIQHVDMIFDDGTCPELKVVRDFINMVHEIITIDKRKIAVHCKAGLGRTGCLIGGYLIYRYGFTANEVIAFMRFMRPGMVVGPQQHWLHMYQDEFRKWFFEDTYKPAATETTRKKVPATPSKRRTLGELTNENEVAATPLPAPTPGQPRKTSSKFYTPRHPAVADENARSSRPAPVAKGKTVEPESEEEQLIRQAYTAGSGSMRRKVSGTGTTVKRRVVSHTSVTAAAPIEVTPAVDAPVTRSASGIKAVKTRTSPRRSGGSGVRKVSGATTRASGGGNTSK